MRNDHPLIQAMQRPNKRMLPPEMKPTLECTKEQLGNCNVGDPVQLSVSGIVQSIGDDGKVMVEVQNVEPEGPYEEAKTPQVMLTQESHSP